jgi:host factor-I protein
MRYLESLIQTRARVTVYLMGGVKLQGKVAEHDEHTLVLVRDGLDQLVYKHAIATVVPF